MKATNFITLRRLRTSSPNAFLEENSFDIFKAYQMSSVIFLVELSKQQEKQGSIKEVEGGRDTRSRSQDINFGTCELNNCTNILMRICWLAWGLERASGRWTIKVQYSTVVV